MSIYLNADCMNPETGLPSYPDKFFDLAIVDPPYGENCKLKGGSSMSGKNGWSGKMNRASQWNTEPEQAYFDEVFRVSRNQIIWGANHFIQKMPRQFQCFLIWDKGQRNFSLADGEMAWTSFDQAARFFSLSRSEALLEGKIHPTQKPIVLYRWILKHFANPGDRILDTHVGSASSLIAFEEMGFDYVGYELDADYYRESSERLAKFRAQQSLFTGSEIFEASKPPSLFGD